MLLDDFDDYGSLDPPVKPKFNWLGVVLVYGTPALLLVLVGVWLGALIRT